MIPNIKQSVDVIPNIKQVKWESVDVIHNIKQSVDVIPNIKQQEGERAGFACRQLGSLPLEAGDRHT